MRWSGLVGMVGGLIGAVTVAVAGCGMEGDDPGTVGADDGVGESAALWRRHRPAPPPPSSTGSGGSGGNGGTTGGSTSGMTTAQAIAAAQTADGRAIPQPAGANGACPEVVVRLGFWSCPTINQTCSFTSAGRTTHCTCSRTDGEGQFPSWICQ